MKASLLVASILALSVSLDQTQVTAFAISSTKTSSVAQRRITTVPSCTTKNMAAISNQDDEQTTTTPPSNDSNVMRLRGGGDAATAPPAAAAPPKKIRIPALDGMRFLLATHIVLGHFLRFANPSAFWLKFFAQVNITVGAFFALSGYVSAYTTSEVGQRVASTRLTKTPSQTWILGKIMGYLPMHALVLLIFSPMFLYSDVNTNGWPTAIWNGIMSFTLTQAWLPMHAEVWNAPTWYLSSLTFSTATLPFALPKISGMDKRGLRRTAAWLMIARILPVLGYAHDHNVWQLVEGMTAPKYHPALAVFNGLRFSPLLNTVEILLGCVFCRLAMMDSADDKNEKPVKTNWLSTAVPMAGLIGILASRAAGIVPDISDMLVRTVLFVPLFLKLVIAMHRNAVAGVKDPISDFLSSKAMLYMGGLSFPIFVVHGPLGQVFYKKIIAAKLWGGVLLGPKNFGLFLGSVLISAWLLQTLFLQNKSVQKWSNTRVEKWSAWM